MTQVSGGLREWLIPFASEEAVQDSRTRVFLLTSAIKLEGAVGPELSTMYKPLDDTLSEAREAVNENE